MAHRLTLLASGVVLALASPAAYAATGSPPVTQPDTVRMHAGEGMQFDLTANDTDPDGDELAVCRLGDDVPRKLVALIAQGQLVVLARAKAEGTYTFTYYACDTSYLTPGQVTVNVGPPAPTLEVIVLGKLPGRVRIVNNYKHRTFDCEWSGEDDEKADGQVTVPPRSSVVITVHETPTVIICSSSKFGYAILLERDRPVVRQRYSANASGGGQAQTRLRSP